MILGRVRGVKPSTVIGRGLVKEDNLFYEFQTATNEYKPKELTELLNSISDYQYLLLMVSMDAQVNSLVKSAFRFFTHSEATFSLDPPGIFLGPLEEKHILDEKHFYDL